jgi:hypothetical protein
VATVQARYPTIGDLASIDVTRRNGLSGPHADGGRVLEVAVRGSRATVVVTGEQLRSALGLKSDWFRVLDPVLASPAVGIAAAPAVDGYVIATRTGEVFDFGAATFHGAKAGTTLNRPIVGVAPSPSGRGYWLGRLRRRHLLLRRRHVPGLHRRAPAQLADRRHGRDALGWRLLAGGRRRRDLRLR